MKLSRRIHIILFMFVLVAAIAITAYVKSPSIFAVNEIESPTTVAVNKDNKQLEEQQKLGKQQKLEVQKKLEQQKKLEAQKKLEEEVRQKKQEEATKQKTSSKIQTGSTKKAEPTTPPTASKPQPKLLIDGINGKGNAGQAIVVTTNNFGSVSATITTFEKVNGKWIQVASFAGDVGRNGFAYNKVEGDGHSPIGIFSLGTAFGRNSNPGATTNYRKSTPNDFWVDDVNSSLYNTWQKGPATGRWNSAENMYIPQYNYGFVINYNTAKRIPGKGSAIFFHVWSGPGHGTAGCTATAQNNVISILKWLKPSENPVIIEGPMSEVLKM